ncbi:hypothetical protein F4821DRAFT_225409 [Hypoxylon rubiginosum]|uniref:Uncharacterized protein n=1 Tax=Hypoxylon rubiginosum TaxID=110542 RepID=A0ACC0DGB6_9PEZI|nr:hypothetical protein F4821DRAFT_225409 [Hypoxylon rubiginosum]
MASKSISNRYVKLEELRNLLTTKFGAGNFQIQETDYSYEVTAPGTITDAEIESIQSKP